MELKLLFLRTLFDWVSVRGSICFFASIFRFLLLVCLICLYFQYTPSMLGPFYYNKVFLFIKNNNCSCQILKPVEDMLN